MKKLILCLAILTCSTMAFAQQKKTTKTRTTPRKVEQPPVIIPPPSDELTVTNYCFVYLHEEKKGDMVHADNTILEYGWAGQNARMVIESKEYDPIKEKEAKEKGEHLVWEETVQYINGKFKITNDVLTFMPDKPERYKTRVFKVIYKGKSKEPDYLIDEHKNKYLPGDCPTPIISVGF